MLCELVFVLIPAVRYERLLQSVPSSRLFAPARVELLLAVDSLILGTLEDTAATSAVHKPQERWGMRAAFWGAIGSPEHGVPGKLSGISSAA